MIYSILVLILFLIIILIKSPNCRFTIYFVSIAVCLSLMLFSNIMFMTKFGNYGTPTLNLFKLDYSIYMVMFKQKISYNTMINIFNLGVGLFAYMSIVFADKYINVGTPSGFTVNKLKKHILYLIFPILNFIFYNPHIGDIFYFTYSSLQSQTAQSLLEYFIRGLDCVKYAVLGIYLFYPIVKLTLYFKELKLNYLKKQLLGILICLTLLNIMGFILLIISPSNRVYYIDFPQCLLNASRTIDLSFNYYSVIFFITFAVIIALVWILTQYRSLDTVDFFGELSIKRNMKKCNKEVRGTYHSLKTHMFTLNVLAQKAQEQYGNPSGLEAVKRIQYLTNKNIDNITVMLNSFNDTRLNVREQSIAKVIESAIETVQFDSITVKLNFKEDVSALCDFYNINECIINLLKNSIDAIKEKGCDGVIQIESYYEQEWAVIKISDNGSGIDCKSKTKIFKPFYSTKSKQSNFGVGLSYVYKIIHKHHGILCFDSVKGEGTSFYLCLKRAV